MSEDELSELVSDVTGSDDDVVEAIGELDSPPQLTRARAHNEPSAANNNVFFINTSIF